MKRGMKEAPQIRCGGWEGLLEAMRPQLVFLESPWGIQFYESRCGMEKREQPVWGRDVTCYVEGRQKELCLTGGTQVRHSISGSQRIGHSWGARNHCNTQ